MAIATYPDSHAALAIQAIELGARVFVEKPLATAVAGAERAVGGILLQRKDGDCLNELPDETGHQGQCDLEQAYVCRAIAENIDLNRRVQDAVKSLRICLSGDENIQLGQGVGL